MRLAVLLSGMLLMVVGDAAASETVRFHTAVVPPTAFKLQLAKGRGETIVPEPTIELSGELFRPPGEGAFPAIVWLHGCLGRRHEDEQRIADHFASQYVVLFVDSFGPRGLRRDCTLRRHLLVDAVGALDYLATRAFVRPGRVAVIGVSQGGRPH